MSRLTIKKKLWILSTFLLLNTFGVGILAFWNSGKLTSQLKNISKVQLPAIKNMTLVDMMHDGLRAVVFHAIIVSATTKESKEIDEVKEELGEFSKNISTYLTNINGLDVEPTTKSAIEASVANVNGYVEAANRIVTLAFKEGTKAATSQLPAFNESFEKLEKDLGALGELIEADAKKAEEKADVIATNASRLNIFFLVTGVLLGLGASWWLTEELVKNLSSLIDSLSVSSEELSRSANQLNSAAGNLSSNTGSQAAAVQETSASIEEISSMVSRSEETAKNLEAVVQKSHSSTEKGKNSISEMLESIDTISKSNELVQKQMEESNRQIGEIVKVISEIGAKTRVINDIVFQTKLLSFNASVEAARAGEHGKGFAVVAEEVGNLAAMSGNAAKEISDMLKDGIERTNSIVNESKSKVGQLMQDTKTRVETGVEVAKQCGAAFEEIHRQFEEVNEMSIQIAAALTEQTKGVHEVSKAIHLFNQGTQQNSAISIETADTAGQVLTQSGNLNKSVDALVILASGKREPKKHTVSDTTQPPEERLDLAA